MAMKTYDRAQVLRVAAQILSGHIAAGCSVSPHALTWSIDRAKELIDEVERQCSLPEKPEPTIAPGSRGKG